MEAPQAPEAERMTLALLQRGDPTCDQILASLSGEHFWSAKNGKILEAARRLRDQKISVDAITLINELERSNILGDVGGRTYIHELAAEYTAVASRSQHFVEIVLDTWTRRQVVVQASQIARVAAEGGSGSEHAVALRDAGAALTAAQGGVLDDALIGNVAERLREVVESTPDTSKAHRTPFTNLAALMPGRMYVLGGYSGDGKTCLAAQFLRLSAGAQKRVAFFTLEMTDLDLLRRLIRAWGIPSRRLEPGELPEHLQANFREAIETVGEWPAWLFTEARTADAITRTSFAAKPDLVIIDHLQHLHLNPKMEARPQLEHALSQFVELSLSLNVPVLLLAQFHRPAGTDKYPRPTMHSFRDTGKIEQLAAACWAIHRPRDTDGHREDEGQFLILKNRFGPDGGFPVRFDDDKLEFVGQ